jgi:hypothetical protein
LSQELNKQSLLAWDDALCMNCEALRFPASVMSKGTQ